MGTLLITGATGGIAQAVIREAANDWQVVALSRKPAPAASVSNRWIQVESYDPAFMASAMAEIEPDALVHTVGSTLAGPMTNITASQFRDLIETNLVCSYVVLQAFLGSLKSRRARGSAVLFSSVVTQIGVAHHEAITAAKAGIDGLAISSAASCASAGIRVNAIAPGLTETALTQAVLVSEAGRAAASKQYPLSGINRPEDIAGTALWLVSDAASRITGQIIPVDGGFSAIRPMVR